MPDISDNTNWSQTDASNNNAPPNGWPEGQMPSTVNDCARADKGALKRFWDRINPVVTTADAPVGDAGGATYVYNTTNTALPSAYVNGEIYRFIAHKASVGSDTFQVNLLPPHGIYNSAGTAIAAGDIKQGAIISLVYLSSLNAGAGGFTYLAYQPGNSAWTVVSGPATSADYTISRASDSTLALKIENASLQVDVAQHLTVGAGAAITGALSVSTTLAAGATTLGTLSAAATSITGTLSATGAMTTPGVRYTGVEGGNQIAFGWNGNIVAHVDATNEGNVALWNTAAQFASGMTVGGLAITNNGGWLQSPSIRASSQLWTDGSLEVVGNATINGQISIGGLALYNNANYLYSPDWLRSTGLQIDGNINASGAINGGSGTIGGVGLSGNNANVPGTMTAGTVTSNGNISVSGTVTGGSFSGDSVSGNNIGSHASGYSLQSADSIYAAGVMLAQAFNQSSDVSLKESVADWKGGLDAVLALRPVSYTLKRDGSGHVGLIADEAEKAIPEMVVLGPGAPGDDAPSIKAIDLSVLPVALVNAVKELAARVKELEAELGKR